MFIHIFKNNFKNNNSHAPFKKTIVLKNQPCAFFGINHTSLRIYKIFTFVKSSHLRIELHLRMLRRSLRRWCRSSDDELHLRRLHLRMLRCICGGGAGAQMMSCICGGCICGGCICGGGAGAQMMSSAADGSAGEQK